jgi:AraC-like DNA-binding protein
MQTRFLAPAISAAPVESPDDRELIKALQGSDLYRRYETAFSEFSGMPLSIRPVESWTLAHRQKRSENRFCAMMAESNSTCAACLRVQQRLCDGAKERPCTATCDFGLSDSAVPVRLGERLLGYLQTGQVFRKRPGKAHFARVLDLVSRSGSSVDREHLKSAYFQTRVLPPKRYEAVVSLLEVFSKHLASVSNQILIRRQQAEPVMVSRAKQFIEENQTEKLSLAQVARAVNASSFYFCKTFRKATGVHFTAYVSRVRIERAKHLILNPNLRISEVAYEVGFQSLTHFNRVFKKLVGQSPSQYRACSGL